MIGIQRRSRSRRRRAPGARVDLVDLDMPRRDPIACHSAQLVGKPPRDRSPGSVPRPLSQPLNRRSGATTVGYRSFSDRPLPMRTAAIYVRPLSMEDLMVGRTAVIFGHEQPPQLLPTLTAASSSLSALPNQTKLSGTARRIQLFPATMANL